MAIGSNIDTDMHSSLTVKNIGNGSALNIELRISQFHPNGGYTNLRNLLIEGFDNFYNFPKGISREITINPNVLQSYIETDTSEFGYGIKDRIAIILTYEDLIGEKFCTVVKVTVQDNKHLTVRNTITSSYDSGNLPQLPIHVITAP